MENINDKYKRIRKYLKDGDIILFRGTSLLSRIIRYCDKSYFTHVGVVFQKLGALYIVDSNANGVQADRLSHRVDKYYPNGDFMVIKPTATNDEIQLALSKILTRSDGKTIKYDFWNGLKELLNRKFNFKFKIHTDATHEICSDYVSTYQVELKMVTDDFLKLEISFPQDSVRYMSQNTIVIN